MKNRRIYFALATLVLFSFWQWAYFVFAAYFNQGFDKDLRLGILEEELVREKARTAMSNYRLHDFQWSVAKLLPETSKIRTDSPLRDLASIVREPQTEGLENSHWEFLMKKASGAFEHKDFENCIGLLRKLLQEEPTHPYVLSAYLMLGESLFQLRKVDQFLELTRSMISQFPDSEKTAMLLLRAGILLKEKHRPEEAEEFLFVINTYFPNTKIAQQAQTLKKTFRPEVEK